MYYSERTYALPWKERDETLLYRWIARLSAVWKNFNPKSITMDCHQLWKGLLDWQLLLEECIHSQTPRLNPSSLAVYHLGHRCLLSCKYEANHNVNLLLLLLLSAVCRTLVVSIWRVCPTKMARNSHCGGNALSVCTNDPRTQLISHLRGLISSPEAVGLEKAKLSYGFYAL